MIIIKFRIFLIMQMLLFVHAYGNDHTLPTSSEQMDSSSKMVMEKSQNNAVPGRTTVELTPGQRQLINIRTIPVVFENANATIRTVGIVTYDQTHLIDVNLKIMGWVEKLYVDKPGQPVTEGQPLMDLYSPPLYSGQQEYLLAFNYYQQLKNSSNKRRGEVPYAGWERNLEEAKSLMESSYKRLKLWDISDDEIKAIEKSGKPTDTLQLKSPVTGYVVEKKIDPGQMIQQGMTLYRIANLSTVWIDADFYEYELPLIKVDQKVIVSLTAYPEKTFEGVVNFIYPYLENKTRTNIVRLVVNNDDGLLKPSMYANIELKIDLGQQLLVPAEAVFNTGLQQYVFVQEGEGIFIPHAIKLGPRAGDSFVIREGLQKGQRVLIDGNFLIDSESQLKKSSEGGGMKGMQGMQQ